MGTIEYSQPASKSSWDSHDFGDINMVLKMAHFPWLTVVTTTDAHSNFDKMLDKTDCDKTYISKHIGPLVLTWINLDPSMDKYSHAESGMRWNYLSIPNFNGCIGEVWE